MDQREQLVLCARAMGYVVDTEYFLDDLCVREKLSSGSLGNPTIYDPIKNDGQAMELLRKFGLNVTKPDPGEYVVWPHNQFQRGHGRDLDVRKAIVQCVAAQQHYRDKAVGAA